MWLLWLSFTRRMILDLRQTFVPVCLLLCYARGAFGMYMYYRCCQALPQLVGDQLIVVLCSKLFLKSHSLPPWQLQNIDICCISYNELSFGPAVNWVRCRGGSWKPKQALSGPCVLMSGGPLLSSLILSLVLLLSPDHGLVPGWLKVSQLASRSPPIGWSWGATT